MSQELSHVSFASLLSRAPPAMASLKCSTAWLIAFLTLPSALASNSTGKIAVMVFGDSYGDTGTKAQNK